MSNNIAKEYYSCHYTGKKLHYSKFVLAKKGWLAIDGTRRHPISKEGKTINQALVNGLRTVVNGVLVGISNTEHPNCLVYKKNVDDVRKENNYNKTWLRVDLTEDALIRTYNDLNIKLPDLDNLNIKGSRKSNGSDACLDYFLVPDDRQHREVKIGKYFVDGLKNNFVIEFFGDYFHANPNFYRPNQKLLGGTAEQKWQKDKLRLESITEKGYNIVKVWENDWNKFKQKLTEKLRVEYNNEEFYIEKLEDLNYE
jgi:hypothetical protein